MKIYPLEIEQVQSVYSGKDGECCCGCKGKHYYASKYRTEAGKDRGYAIDDDEISDRMIKKVTKIINEANITDIDDGDSYLAVTIGTRLYIAYLRT